MSWSPVHILPQFRSGLRLISFTLALLASMSLMGQSPDSLDQEIEEAEKGLLWLKEGVSKVDEARRQLVAKNQEKKAARLIEKGRYDDAAETYKKAIEHYRWLGDSLAVAKVFMDLADMANQLKELEDSREFFRAAKVAAGEPAVKPVKVNLNLDIPEPPTARESVSVIPSTRPAEMDREASLPVIGGQAATRRREAAEAYRNTESYRREYENLMGRIKAAEKARKDDSLVQALLIEQATQEIANLEQEQAIQDLELERQQNLKIGLIIGLGFLSIIAILLWRLLATRRKAQKQTELAYEELAEAHTQLQETQAQLVQAEKMASLGQLTAGIAHEINNPVNYISGSVNPLRRDVETLLDVLNRYMLIAQKPELAAHFTDVERYKEEVELDYLQEEIEMLLKGMVDGTNRTTEIVAGLLDFSRIEESDRKQVDLHAGLDSTLNLLGNQVKDKVDIVRAYDPTLPAIKGYPGKLNQVFMNLFTNALQAMEDAKSPNPTLSLTTEYDPEAKVARIRIRDNGTGIPEKLLPRIFEPFFTTKDVGSGTGLGLSISYGIIAEHGGTINARNHPEGGAEFVVELPVN